MNLERIAYLVNERESLTRRIQYYESLIDQHTETCLQLHKRKLQIVNELKNSQVSPKITDKKVL